MSKIFLRMGCLAVCATWAVNVYAAQSYDKIKPHSLEVQKPADKLTLPDAESKAEPAESTLIIDVLTRLVLLSTEKSMSSMQERVDIEALSDFVSPSLKSELLPYLDKPLYTKTLEEIKTVIQKHFSGQGYPFVNINLPKQEVTGGTVTLLVSLPVLSDITIEGNQYFDDSFFTKRLQVELGSVMRKSEIRQSINALNANPFVQNDFVIGKGETDEQLTLDIHAAERRPFYVYTGIDDTGNKLTGDDRIYAGFEWGNAFGLGHRFGYQHSASTDYQDVKSHAFNYIAPLADGDIVEIYGGYSEVDLKTRLLPDDSDKTHLEGESKQLSARYNHPAYFLGMKQVFSAGFDWKYATNSAELSFINLLEENPTNIGQFGFKVSNESSDKYGLMAVSAELIHNPGSWVGKDSNENYRGSRYSADSSYNYAQLTLFRETELPLNAGLYTDLVYQFSDANLLASEQLGMGGHQSIRGYEEFEVNNVDEGFVLRNELKPQQPFDIALVSGWLNNEKATEKIWPFVFWDYGQAIRHKPEKDIDERKRVTLSSVGAGFDYTLFPYITTRFSYGFQMHALPGEKKEDRMHFNFQIAF